MRNRIIFLLCLLFFSGSIYAQPCTPQGDETSYGTNNVWIGYAYDNIDFTNYKGYVNEGTAGSASFDESFGGDDVNYTTNGCAIFTSTFSMRYKLTKTFSNGFYIFTAGGDDGFRLSLDGGTTWVIDNWGDHSYTTNTYAASLNGTYNMVLEYYENGGGNRVSFDVTPACIGTENTSIYGTNNIWNGYIYDGINFDLYTGMVNEGTAGSLNFDESFGGSNVLYATSSCNVQTETFSARYRLTKTFAYGNYVFTVGGDDGYRLSIDGGATWLVNQWNLQSYNTTMSPVITLNGTYNLVLEYYENGGDNRISITAQALTILPVDLTTFDAAPKNNEVELNWSVGAGSTPKQFQIERSSNGINFSTVITTAATAGLQYTATDKTVTPGTWYYRLKITDISGSIYYSKTLAARIETVLGNKEALFYPTIVTNNIVRFKSSSNISNATLTVTDINGRVVSQENIARIISGVAVALQITAPGNKLSAGFYMIKISGAKGELVTGRVMVQ
ncbi:PA14 domain-containing protein [Ferruginibacter sp. SUN106]|uniref:PA14 domain-containing protein n=1 Tax=Ferruginibacter sp. SUN106 TaxID=2978348 RepID=UPI003D35E243